MTGKQRIMAAIAMQPTDRQPRDFHGCGVVVQRLHEYFGTTSYRALLDKLNVDMADIRGVVDPVWVADFAKVRTLPDGSTEDYLGFRKKVQDTVYGPVEEHCDYIVSDCESIDEIKERYRFPSVEWFDFSQMSQQLREYEGLAIMASGASVYQHPTLIRGLDQLLCDLLTEPEIAEFIIDGYVDFYHSYYDAMFRACPGQIDIMRIADDFGMQDRPLLSRSMMEEFFIPRIKRLCDMAHSHGVQVMFHSCGAVFEFIDLLIAAGVDMLDPLQPNAKDMSPEHLKEHFEGKICFHGSIDTQYILPQGSAEQVREQVRSHIAVLGASGTGFVVAPAHTLQPDVKTENIVALYDEIDRISMTL